MLTYCHALFINLQMQFSTTISSLMKMKPEKVTQPLDSGTFKQWQRAGVTARASVPDRSRCLCLDVRHELSHNL